MFEQMTYEKLLADMLASVTSRVDKREGSIIWDALAPAALELSRLYQAMDEVLREGFADTAGREYLILRALERGITPYPATYAGALAKLEGEVPLGARFYCGGFNWVVEQQLTDGNYLLRAEEAGSAPNGVLGRLTPLEYLEDLASAEIVDIIEPGADEESTEALRQRYLNSLTEQSFGGNCADYIAKAMTIPGVGAVKVTPAYAGGGTVKLTIMDSAFDEPSAALIEKVQNMFDPPEESGLGLGLAPIGHQVTVEGAAAAAVEVSASLVFAAGYQWVDLSPAVLDCLDEYFSELTHEWAASDQLTVRISQLETRLLQLPGILDISDVRINDTAANLQLAANEFPVRGDFYVQ